MLAAAQKGQARQTAKALALVVSFAPIAHARQHYTQYSASDLEYLHYFNEIVGRQLWFGGLSSAGPP